MLKKKRVSLQIQASRFVRRAHLNHLKFLATKRGNPFPKTARRKENRFFLFLRPFQNILLGHPWKMGLGQPVKGAIYAAGMAAGEGGATYAAARRLETGFNRETAPFSTTFSARG